jgi:hypothetical protein
MFDFGGDLSELFHTNLGPFGVEARARVQNVQVFVERLFVDVVHPQTKVFYFKSFFKFIIEIFP